MLFVSRHTEDDYYGVVDTDDDIETLVPAGNFVDILRAGVKISGVTLLAGDVVHIEVQQYPGTFTKLQVKTKAVLGVDIRVYDGEITYVGVDTDVLKSGTSIRLSDFGNKFHWNTEVDVHGRSPVIPLILIIDDELQVSALRLNDAIQFDLREYSDDEVVERLYRGIIRRYRAAYDKFDEFVLDKSDRILVWRSVAMLSDTITGREEFLQKAQQSERWPEIGRRVAEIYSSQFEAIAKSSVDKVFFNTPSLENFKEFQRVFLEDGILKFRGCTDFDILKEKMLGIFQVLKFATIINSTELLRFENYIRFYVVTDEVKQMYVKLCNNTIDYLLRVYGNAISE